MSQRMKQQKQQERNDESEKTARRHEGVRELVCCRIERENWERETAKRLEEADKQGWATASTTLLSLK